MTDASHGVGGLKYDPKKRAKPPELNVFIALVLIVVTFEAFGRILYGDSFLFNTRDNVDAIFNWPRLNIIILQVAIVGVIALGVTQVIICGGAAIILSSKNLTAQAGMGVMYELDAIAMTVIGGVSLTGGRGSIIGTVIGALIFGVILSGFTFLKLDAYYQEMVKGAIIVGAVVLDQWRQRRAAIGG